MQTESTWIVKGSGVGGVQQLVEQYDYVSGLSRSLKRNFPSIRNLRKYRDYAEYEMEDIQLPTLRDCLIGNPRRSLQRPWDSSRAIQFLGNLAVFAFTKLSTHKKYPVPGDHLEFSIYGKYRQRIQKTKDMLSRMRQNPEKENYYLSLLNNLIDANSILIGQREYENPSAW